MLGSIRRCGHVRECDYAVARSALGAALEEEATYFHSWEAKRIPAFWTRDGQVRLDLVRGGGLSFILSLPEVSAGSGTCDEADTPMSDPLPSTGHEIAENERHEGLAYVGSVEQEEWQSGVKEIPLVLPRVVSGEDEVEVLGLGR